MTANASSSTVLPPLGKQFTSTDKKTRDKAVKSVAIFLSSHDELSNTDMDKLWKGIFYCFWMSDKPLVQQALASELAELVLTTKSTTMSLQFLEGFWTCLIREWNGIDRLRMDKFYMLVRRFVNVTFRLLIRENWRGEICERYANILSHQGGPLCPSDMRIPTSLSYHLSEIYLDELDKALAASSRSSASTPLVSLVSPFLRVAAQTPTTSTYKQIESTILEPLLLKLSPSDVGEDEEPKAKKPRLTEGSSAKLYACLLSDFSMGEQGRDGVKKQLLRSIFQIASEAGTRDSNRRKLYALWESAGGEPEES